MKSKSVAVVLLSLLIGVNAWAGYLNLLTNTTAPSATSNSTLAAETDEIQVRIRIDGAVFLHVAGIGGGGFGRVLRVYDGSTTDKFYIDISGDGAGNVEAYIKMRPGGDEAHSGVVVASSSFTSGTDVIIMAQFSQSSHSGSYAQCHVMSLAGSLIGTPSDLTYSPGVMNASTGVVLMNDQAVQKFTGKIDGLAITTGSGNWLSGAAAYAVPTSGDAGLVTGWMFGETSGSTAANLKAGAQTLSIPGTETTDFAWAAGGGWDAGSGGGGSNLLMRRRRN